MNADPTRAIDDDGEAHVTPLPGGRFKLTRTTIVDANTFRSLAGSAGSELVLRLRRPAAHRDERTTAQNDDSDGKAAVEAGATIEASPPPFGTEDDAPPKTTPVPPRKSVAVAATPAEPVETEKPPSAPAGSPSAQVRTARQ